VLVEAAIRTNAMAEWNVDVKMFDRLRHEWFFSGVSGNE
jgi:hypothetical protein